MLAFFKFETKFANTFRTKLQNGWTWGGGKKNTEKTNLQLKNAQLTW